MLGLFLAICCACIFSPAWVPLVLLIHEQSRVVPT